jgi:hypothetical protein
MKEENYKNSLLFNKTCKTPVDSKVIQTHESDTMYSVFLIVSTSFNYGVFCRMAVNEMWG